MLTITLLVLLALSLAGNALHLPAVRARLGFDSPSQPQAPATDPAATDPAKPDISQLWDPWANT